MSWNKKSFSCGKQHMPESQSIFWLWVEFIWWNVNRYRTENNCTLWVWCVNVRKPSILVSIELKLENFVTFSQKEYTLYLLLSMENKSHNHNFFCDTVIYFKDSKNRHWNHCPVWSDRMVFFLSNLSSSFCSL